MGTRTLVEIERRALPLVDVEIREGDGTGGPIKFTGLAAVFNEVVDLGWWREQIAAGAFAKTLQEKADVRFLFNHNPDSVMARTTNGTLRLAENDRGLDTGADLNPEDLDVQRLVPKLQDRNVTQMSFAFRVVKDEWDLTDEAHPLRTIREVELYDVSAVTFPAYPQTEAEARQAVQFLRRMVAGIGIPSILEEARKAIGVHHTGTSDSSWDGPANEGRLPSGDPDAVDALRAAHAWVDPESNPEAKSSYKGIHHEVSESGDVGDANVKGCTALIQVLNGGRGGIDIPDGDRQGVYNHAAAHIRDAGEEPAELNSAPLDVDEVLEHVVAEARAGRVLSEKNRQLVEQARDALTELLDAAEPPPEPADDHSGDRSLQRARAERHAKLRERLIAIDDDRRRTA